MCVCVCVCVCVFVRTVQFVLYECIVTLEPLYFGYQLGRRKCSLCVFDQLISPSFFLSSSLPPAQKIVLTGPKSQTIHREELGMSNAERRVKTRVEDNARVQQRKMSAMTERQSERQSERQAAKRSPVSLFLSNNSSILHSTVVMYVLYMYTLLCGSLLVSLRLSGSNSIIFSLTANFTLNIHTSIT